MYIEADFKHFLPQKVPVVTSLLQGGTPRLYDDRETKLTYGNNRSSLQLHWLLSSNIESIRYSLIEGLMDHKEVESNSIICPIKMTINLFQWHGMSLVVFLDLKCGAATY